VSRPLAVDDALEVLGSGLDDARVGLLGDRPLLAVQLDGARHDDLRRLAAAVRTAPVVVVGVTAGAALDPSDRFDPFDVLLCADGAAGVPRPWVAADLEPLERAVHASPEASVALVQLLRVSNPIDVREAVVAESFVYSLLQTGEHHRGWLADRRPAAGRPPTEQAVVRLDRTGDTLTVVLDRPDVRNAYSARMRDELVAALHVAVADPTVRVELRGAGPDFCSGGDLDEFGTTPSPTAAHLIRTTRNAGLVLAHLAERTDAFVHGHCVGAGVELPAFCARVVASPDATFRLPEVAMGLVPGAGGTASIPRRIGRQRTAHLALTGDELDAAAALAWGLVDAIAADR
jgi:hypothetical protein